MDHSIQELALLQFIRTRNKEITAKFEEPMANFTNPIPWDEASAATGIPQDELCSMVAEFDQLGWIDQSGGPIRNFDNGFVAMLIREGLREVSQRADRVVITGEVKIALVCIGDLKLDSDSAMRLSALVAAFEREPDTERKATRLKEMLTLLSNVSTSADFVFKYIPFLAALAAQIAR